MFEHLVSQHHVLGKPKKKRVRFYGSLLLLVGFILLSASNIGQGPQSAALDERDVIEGIRVDVYNQATKGTNQLTDQTPQAMVFDFIIRTNKKQINLDALGITVNGLENLDLLRDIDLYHGDTQLGQVSKIIDNQLYFEINSYNLNQGTNNFYLTWDNIDNELLEKTIEFAIVEATDIFVSYQNIFFMPEGEFPISSKKLNIIDIGELSSYNNLVNNKFLAVADQNQKLADFSLATHGESMKLEEVSIAIEDALDAEGSFYLFSNKKVIAQSYIKNNNLNFKLTEPVVIKNNSDLPLQLQASLPIGEYKFSLVNAQGKGFVSGDTITLDNNLVLSEVVFLPSLAQFTSQSSAAKLGDAWNALSTINIANLGSVAINIHKLSWSVEEFGIDVQNLELWINDQLYDTDLNIDDDKVTATFWKVPLLLDDTDLNIVLLGEADILSEQSRLQINLLTDKTAMSEDNSDNNLLWSVNSQMYNSYLLPGLPLTPVILE